MNSTSSASSSKASNKGVHPNSIPTSPFQPNSRKVYVPLSAAAASVREAKTINYSSSEEETEDQATEEEDSESAESESEQSSDEEKVQPRNNFKSVQLEGRTASGSSLANGHGRTQMSDHVRLAEQARASKPIRIVRKGIALNVLTPADVQQSEAELTVDIKEVFRAL